ncbi:MAG: hypothetical protein AAFX81_05800 [Pseudomonadota bacterium]
MNVKNMKYLLACLLTMTLCGCGELQWTSNSAVQPSGAKAILVGDGKSGPGNDFTPVDITNLLVPGGLANPKFASFVAETTTSGVSVGQRESMHLSDAQTKSLAFAYFEQLDPDNPGARRNEMQDRIMAVSEQRCAVWKQYLSTVDSGIGAALGVLATVAGGVGALLTNASAQIASGIAGIAAGIDKEADNALLAGQFISVVTSNVDATRKQIRTAIDTKRLEVVPGTDPPQKQPVGLELYSVGEALLDAERFHAACSLSTGIGDKGASSEAVGLTELEQVIKQLKSINDKAEEIKPIILDQRKYKDYLIEQRKKVDTADSGES